MSNSSNRNIVNLGIFSLGASYFFYCLMQYFFTPLCWWLAQHIEMLSWMNEIFIFYEQQDLSIFTTKSITYSFIGIVAFFSGYNLLPARLARTRSKLFKRNWNLLRAERIFWLIFISGFSLKLLKIIGGLDIESAIFVERGVISNQTLLFFLSLNWLHLVGFVIINIVYQEANLVGHRSLRRFKMLAYLVSIFVITASLAGGSRMATLAPVIALLIINRYYSRRSFSFVKYAFYLLFFVVIIFFVQFILLSISKTYNSTDEVNSGFRFAFFYILFYRVNMSQAVAVVLEKGQLAFPDGTFGQFWIDMGIYGSEKINIIDGNEFGRAMGLITPENFTTGIASTNIGDLFINHGLWGIVFGMLTTGFIYKLLFSNCERPFPVFIMLYSLLWPILIHGVESPISVLYSTSIKMILLCLTMHIVIVFRIPRKQRAAYLPYHCDVTKSVFK
ncbi:O-antigen polymerase [Shewanella sp.]|uniref:O-antigen polymerase n=1 Tax=Shewanella sp. TaxID=50422 RepID=UPI004047EFF2